MIRVDFGGFEQEAQQIAEALGDLDGKTARVLTNAINMAARKTRQQIVKDAKGRYQLTKKGQLKASAAKLTAAKTSDGTATIRASGPWNELMDFAVAPKAVPRSQAERVSYAAHVLRATGLKSISNDPGHNPFVTQFKSGHIAIVQRVPGTRMKSDSKKEALEKLLSPGVPHMLQSAAIRGDAEVIFWKELPAAIEKAIENTLAKAAKENA